METLVIRNPSLGGYTAELQEAFLQGFRMSLKPIEYPHLDNQFNATLIRSETVTEHVCAETAVLSEIAKKTAGRPPRNMPQRN